jgi:SET domain-containing protein
VHRKARPRRTIRVARSSTGLGLFAAAPFRKGDFIAEYTGRRIPNAEADDRERRGARYMFQISNRWTIDGSPRSNIARYANHSCRPNAESDVVKGRVILRAIRPIAPGDEITYDYGEDYFELFFRRAGCRCEKCREQRREQSQRRRPHRQTAANLRKQRRKAPPAARIGR